MTNKNVKYQMYENETSKKPLVRGKETNDYKEWEEDFNKFLNIDKQLYKDMFNSLSGEIHSMYDTIEEFNNIYIDILKQFDIMQERAKKIDNILHRLADRLGVKAIEHNFYKEITDYIDVVLGDCK